LELARRSQWLRLHWKYFSNQTREFLSVHIPTGTKYTVNNKNDATMFDYSYNVSCLLFTPSVPVEMGMNTLPFTDLMA